MGKLRIIIRNECFEILIAAIRGVVFERRTGK